MIKIIAKLKTIIIIQINTKVLHITCNLKHSIPKEIPVVFYNRSNNDYPFVKEELTKEF